MGRSMRWEGVLWLWRRLGRMSPLEVAYRTVEQVRRQVDRLQPRRWSAYGRTLSEVAGLPLSLADLGIDDAAKARLAAEARDVIEGRFTLLGQTWPDMNRFGPRWWEGAAWLIDPVSATFWPGAERYGFDVDYRGGDGRGDVKFVWELNRLQFLPALALQEDRARAGQVFALLRGWMRVNPPWRGVNWTSGIEAASRVVSLLTLLAFTRPATSVDKAAVRRFLDAHVRWIARNPSRFSSANNHRIAELTALFLAAISAPGLKGSKRLLRRSKAGLEQEMLRQFHSDGVGAEQSTHYAAYSLEWFTLAGMVSDAAGLPVSPAFRARARAALDHLRWLIDDGGDTPRIGDADDGRVFGLSPPRPSYVASVAAMTSLWLGEAGAPSPTCVRTFAKGGQTVWRRPRPEGAALLVFDHGPLGYRSIAAHGHADALSLWLHWGEEAVFTDPGTYLYHSVGPMRDALRGTTLHNTLALGGEDQSRIVGPFAWADHARTRIVGRTADKVEAEHDGYRRRFGLIHRRRVRFDGDVIHIDDRLVGRPKAPGIPWSFGFNLTPSATVRQNSLYTDIKTPEGRSLTVSAETERGDALTWTAAEIPYATSFGRLSTTTRLSLSGVVKSSGNSILVRIKLNPD